MFKCKRERVEVWFGKELRLRITGKRMELNFESVNKRRDLSLEALERRI